MRILLSAYACEPDKGSEPAVGWNWAVELSKKKYIVHVLTRKNNKISIDAYFKKYNKPHNLIFHYYDLPSFFRVIKKESRFIRFYYLFWQIGSYFFIKKIINRYRFNIIHHVTFVGIRQPSFLCNFGIPFIFGPVGGGDSIPFRLRYRLGFKSFFYEITRDFFNFFIKFDPFMWNTFFKSKIIFVTSEQSKKLIPKIFHHKVKLKLAIGFNASNIKYPKTNLTKNKTFKFIFVGRFLSLKGMDLGIKAFHLLEKEHSNISLTMIGSGPELNSWTRLSKKLNLDSKIHWIPWIENKEVLNKINESDVLLFPSLRDSGGMVIFEAMAAGKPCIVINNGGPGQIITNECGYSIPLNNSYDVTIEKIYNAMKVLIEDKSTYRKLSKNSRKIIKYFSWSKLINGVYQSIK